MGDVRSGLWTSGALEFWFQCNALYALYLVICTFYPVTDVCSCSWGALLCGVPRLNKWTESHWWSYQTDRCLYNQLSCHLKRESCTTPWRKREGWSLESKYFVTECSGGSRGGARGARLPPLFLDQNSLPKLLFWEATPPPHPLCKGLDDRDPPYLKVWIRHWNVFHSATSKRFWSLFLKPLTIIFF